jgi:hypothetical protein
MSNQELLAKLERIQEKLFEGMNGIARSLMSDLITEIQEEASEAHIISTK